MSNLLKIQILNLDINDLSQENVDTLFKKLLPKVNYKKLQKLLNIKDTHSRMCYNCRKIYLPDEYQYIYGINYCEMCDKWICYNCCMWVDYTYKCLYCNVTISD